MNIQRIIFSQLILALVILANSACVQQKAMSIAETPKIESQANLSPTDERIKTAKDLVDKMPEIASNYNKLASAILKKVRETGDYSLNRTADEALLKALAIEPTNFEAKLLQTHILLSDHKFAEALEKAQMLAKERPTEMVVYAAQTDALIELGKYDEAVKTAQTMVDLRPSSVSYARVAHLRYFFGDIDGALEARKLAVQTADPQDAEAIAWNHVELGNVYFNSGKFENSLREYESALTNFPNYYLALAGKAKVLAAKGDFENAINFYKQAQDRVPLPETVIALGDLFEKVGKTDDAQKQYDLVELIEQKLNNTDQRRLALLWADHDIRLDEALSIAQREHEMRQDIYTADILAWCLFKKGQFQDAKKAITEAMRLKTKDARIFYHAGMIEKSLGNNSEAKRLLQLALKTNLAFDLRQSEIAKQNL